MNLILKKHEALLAIYQFIFILIAYHYILDTGGDAHLYWL